VVAADQLRCGTAHSGSGQCLKNLHDLPGRLDQRSLRLDGFSGGTGSHPTGGTACAWTDECHRDNCWPPTGISSGHQPGPSWPPPTGSLSWPLTRFGIGPAGSRSGVTVGDRSGIASRPGGTDGLLAPAMPNPLSSGCLLQHDAGLPARTSCEGNRNSRSLSVACHGWFAAAIYTKPLSSASGDAAPKLHPDSDHQCQHQAGLRGLQRGPADAASAEISWYTKGQAHRVKAALIEWDVE
jgi:hypothetical protein